MIGNSVIAGLFAESMFALLFPILLLVLWKKRTGASVTPFFVGAAVFFLFAMVLEQVLHTICLGIFSGIRSNPAAYILYGGFAAGIFEETGRFLAFRLMKKHIGRENAVTYGIGHGGMEAMLLVGVNMLLYGVCALMMNAGGAEALSIFGTEAQAALPGLLQSLTAESCFWGTMERLAAIGLHIGLSVFVFAAVHQPGKLWLYPAAVLLHAGIDFIPGLYQMQILTSLPLTEVLVLLYSGVTLLLAVRIYRTLPKGEPKAEAGKHPLLGTIVVVVLLVMYLLGYGAVALLIPGIPRFVKILIGGVVLAVIALLIALLTQRIGELKSGELDDLDQY